MEITKHTPGPWNHDKSFPCCVWANGVWVASTNVESVKDLSERESNARLIAAAPDMLAALKIAEAHIAELREAWQRGFISEHDGQGGTRSNRNVDAHTAIWKARAKAEGK